MVVEGIAMIMVRDEGDIYAEIWRSEGMSHVNLGEKISRHME